MSYTNGFQTLIQSMNGLLTFNDGGGTVIENGTITTQSLSLNTILATLPIYVVNLWTNLTFGTANLMTNINDGVINIGSNLSAGALGVLSMGNQLCSITIGAFTFVGNTINTGLTSNLSLFPTYNGAVTTLFSGVLNGTVNICNAMTSGTFNIGRGGNINLGSASTGVILKLDGNGLDNKVFISPQAGASGTVKIGTADNSNQIGTIFIKNNNISTTNGANGTFILTGVQQIAWDNQLKPYPSFIRVATGLTGTQYYSFQDFVCGGNTNILFDVRQYVETDGSRTSEGQGFLQTTCRTNQFFYNGSQIPKATAFINALTMGYYNGTDDASYISGGAPYGGISLGGCGTSNPIAYNGYVQAMTIYPYYGLRLYTGGFSFDKGTFQPGTGGNRGWVPQCGVYPYQTTAIAAGSSIQVTMTYGYTFSANPFVTVSVITNGSGGNTNALVATIYEISTTQVKINLKNTSGGSTAGSQWGFHYIAWAPY